MSACSRYLRFNWHSIIIVVIWSRWEPVIVTPLISHSVFYREKSAPVQLSLLQQSKQVCILDSNESTRTHTYTLRSCYIFGLFLETRLAVSMAQTIFFRSFYDKNSWLDTETETAIRKLQQYFDDAVILSVCLFVWMSVFFHVSCSFAAWLLKKM